MKYAGSFALDFFYGAPVAPIVHDEINQFNKSVQKTVVNQNLVQYQEIAKGYAAYLSALTGFDNFVIAEVSDFGQKSDLLEFGNDTTSYSANISVTTADTDESISQMIIGVVPFSNSLEIKVNNEQVDNEDIIVFNTPQSSVDISLTGENCSVYAVVLVTSSEAPRSR